jgi:hypothetical protein
MESPGGTDSITYFGQLPDVSSVWRSPFIRSKTSSRSPSFSFLVLVVVLVLVLEKLGMFTRRVCSPSAWRAARLRAVA